MENEVGLAIPIQIGDANPGSHRVKATVVSIADRLAGLESTVGAAAEQEELAITVAAVVRAGDEIKITVAIVVHQLWTERGATSSDRNPTVGHDLVEPDRIGEFWPVIRSEIPEHPHPAGVLADE